MISLNVRFLLFIAIFFSFPFLGLTQNDTTEIKELVLKLFDGMRQSDTLAMKSCFQDDCKLYTAVTRGENSRLFSSEVKDFITSVGKEHKEIYDERLGEYTIKIDGVLASMEVKYYFFLDDKLSHCGTNFFSLFKSDDGWKIFSLADTRQMTDCNIPDITW